MTFSQLKLNLYQGNACKHVIKTGRKLLEIETVRILYLLDLPFIILLQEWEALEKIT